MEITDLNGSQQAYEEVDLEVLETAKSDYYSH
jgi:hypothetical protein